MNKTVEVYKSPIFQNDVNHLSFKENNFTFKQCRKLVEMLKTGLNVAHLEKLEKQGFEMSLHALKIKKDRSIVLILEEKWSVYTLTLLRCVHINELAEALDTLNVEGIMPYDFAEFWTILENTDGLNNLDR